MSLHAVSTSMMSRSWFTSMHLQITRIISTAQAVPLVLVHQEQLSHLQHRSKRRASTVSHHVLL
jgi:hypothetical protein